MFIIHLFTSTIKFSENLIESKGYNIIPHRFCLVEVNKILFYFIANMVLEWIQFTFQKECIIDSLCSHLNYLPNSRPTSIKCKTGRLKSRGNN